MKIEFKREKVIDKWAKENKVLVNECGSFYAYIRYNKQVIDRLKQKLKELETKE